VGTQEHLAALAAQAEPWLEPAALQAFRKQWLLDPQTVPSQRAAEQHAAALSLSSRLPVRLLQALHPELWLDAPGPPAGPQLRLQQAVGKGHRAYPLLRDTWTSPPGALVPFTERPFGVNLIGHAVEVFGIGEDIRMAARALADAGIPHCVIHHPAGNGAACSDRSLEPWLCTAADGGPYAFNLVCMAAPIQARWLLQGGLAPLQERYTIAAWPWETRQWPKAWLPLLEVADEVWPSSSFTAAALEQPAATAAKPLQPMPMAAEVAEPNRFCSPTARLATRARHSLPADAVLFVYSFDFNSTAIRKNPMGALEAFQLAFPLPELPACFGLKVREHPLSQQVALLIKTFPPRWESAEWHWLRQRAGEDPRIHLVVASLERDPLLALYGCCDVYLSLHRSEGFGRGLAEALQLGLDVIASAYGGNTDFCTGPLAHPVRCREVPIPRGAYPGADGHVWGEPDLEHAAELMQQVATRRIAITTDPAADPHDPSCDSDLLAAYRERFSCAAAGERYRERLLALWNQRQELGERLKRRANAPD
jgi:glycosyltransferase involved in cell wall biosynthesis